MESGIAIWQLFAGTAGALVVATLVGLTLRRRFGHTPAIDNYMSRTWSWWIMVIVMALAFVTGPVGTVLLYAAASGVALYEFLILTEAGDSDRNARLASFAIMLPVQYAFVLWGNYGMFVIFIPVYGFLFLPILSALQSDTKQFMARVAEMQWALMLAVYCLSHVPALLLVHIPDFEGRNILMLAFLVVVVEASDVFQYLWGKLLGRHKLVPALSPSKTVEGLAGGVITASLIGMGLWWLTPFTPVQALGMAGLTTIIGFLGGLVMSAMKRDRGVKDWGRIIPGHGGMLDRLDSLLFAAPVYFHVIRYWWGD